MSTTGSLIATSHAVSAFGKPRVDGDGRLFVSTMTKKGRPGRLHAMETQELGEGVKHTLNLCLLHEMSADASNFSWSFSREWPLYVSFGRDQKHPEGTHVKLFYLIDIKGELRTFEKPDPPDILTGFEEWEIDALLRHMTRVGTVPVHLAATKALLRHFGTANYAVYERYSKLFADCPKQELGPVEHQALRSYFEKNMG